jgi:hypothetical protein
VLTVNEKLGWATAEERGGKENNEATNMLTTMITTRPEACLFILAHIYSLSSDRPKEDRAS